MPKRKQKRNVRPTIGEQLEWAHRTLYFAQDARVRDVRGGRITEREAELELRVIEAVVDTLERVKSGESKK